MAEQNERIDYDNALMDKAHEMAVASIDEEGVKDTERKEAIKKRRRELYGKLVAQYPFDIGELKRNKLKKTKPQLFLDFFAGDNRDPILGEGDKGFNKFEDIIKDNVSEEIAGAKSWYDMTPKQLEKVAKKKGYDPNDKESLGKFYDELQKAQTAYDKGVISDELADSVEGLGLKLFAPSTYDEAQRQILTGEGDEGDIWKMFAIDALANGGMAFAPGAFRTMGSPAKDLFKGAFVQGALEGARQGGKVAIDENLNVNPSDVILATSLGIGAPILTNKVASYIRAVPSDSMKRFAFGMKKAARTGDPTMEEAKRIMNGYDTRLANIRRAEEGRNMVSVKEAADMMEAQDILAKLDALGIDPAGKSQKEINNLIKERYDSIVNGDVYFDANTHALKPEAQKEYDTLNRLFNIGMKAGAENGSGKAYRSGIRAGQILNALNQSIMPIAKAPAFFVGDYKRTTDYMDEDWFKKLNEDQKAALKKAMEDKKKREKK